MLVFDVIYIYIYYDRKVHAHALKLKQLNILFNMFVCQILYVKYDDIYIYIYRTN